MIPKHLSYEDFLRYMQNRHQQEAYLDYYCRRMDFWNDTLQTETDPLWFDVAYQNFMMVADRVDHLSSLLF